MDFDAVKKLIEYGYALLPVEERGKKPLTKNAVKDASVEPDQVKKWYQQYHGSNWGISCTNLLVLDIDGIDGEKDFAEIAAEIGAPDCKFITQTGGGGRHLFFTYEGENIIGRAKIEYNGRKTDIDIRTGNQYVIAPGSIHSNGKTYKAIEGPVSVTELTRLPKEWLDILPKRNKKQTVTQTPAAAPALSNWNDDDLVERAKRYLDKIPASIQGQNGSAEMLRACNFIFWGLGLDRNDARAVELLGYYNARSNPVWEGAELEHKISEALKGTNAEKPRGWLLEEFLKPCNDLTDSVNIDWDNLAVNGVPPKEPEPEAGGTVIVKDDSIKNADLALTLKEQDFPVEVFPEGLQEYCYDVARSYSIPLSYVGVGILSVVSAAIGRSIRSDYSAWFDRRPLYHVMILGVSANGKSQALNRLKIPFLKLQEEAVKEYGNLCTKFDEKRAEALEKKDKAEAAKYEIYPEKKRVFFNRNLTMEGAQNSLAALENFYEYNGGVLWYGDEGSGILEGLGQFKKGKANSDLSDLLELLDGTGFDPVRAKDIGRTCSMPHVNFLGGTQPETLEKIAKDNPLFLSRGLFSRFNFVFSAASFKTRRRRPNEKLQALFDSFVMSLSEGAKKIRDEEFERMGFCDFAMVKPRPIKFNEEALKSYGAYEDYANDFWNTHQVGEYNSNPLSSFMQKSISTVSDLSLAFYAIDKYYCADIDCIDEAIVNKAKAVTLWHVNEYLRMLSYWGLLPDLFGTAGTESAERDKQVIDALKLYGELRISELVHKPGFSEYKRKAGGAALLTNYARGMERRGLIKIREVINNGPNKRASLFLSLP